MLGSCFLSLLQVQSQFMSSAADLMCPLGGFQEIGDYLQDREVTLALKDATSTWLSLAQVEPHPYYKLNQVWYQAKLKPNPK